MKKKDFWVFISVVAVCILSLILFWSLSAPGSTAVDHTDYAEDQFGRGLYWWTVLYYEVVGNQPGDTVLVAVDTTDSIGEYTVSLHTGWYLVYAFSNSNDSTDLTPYPRKAFMKAEPFIAMVGDSTFFDFVKADSGFIGTVQGNIATADSAEVAHKAYTADIFKVRQLRKFPHHLKGALPFAFQADDGKLSNKAWADTAAHYGVPMTFFIVPGYVGLPGIMSWAQVCSVAQTGGLGFHEIASHSMTHPNMATLYNDGEIDSLLWELERSKALLDSVLRADVDSTYNIKGFSWPGSAKNPGSQYYASAVYQWIRNGAEGTYAEGHTNLEMTNIYNLLLYVHSPTMFRIWENLDARGAITTQQIKDRIDSLVVHMPMITQWTAIDTGYVGGTVYKEYGTKSLGSMLVHGMTYQYGVVPDTVTLHVPDSLFSAVCQRLKYWEDQGNIWLCTMSEYVDWCKDNMASGAMPGFYGSATPRKHPEIYHTRIDTARNKEYMWDIVNEKNYWPLRIRNTSGFGAIHFTQDKDWNTWPDSGNVPYGLYGTQSGNGRLAFFDADTGSCVMIRNTAPTQKALWVWGSTSRSKFDGNVTIGGHTQIDSTLTVGMDGTGYDMNCYGDSSSGFGSRLFWNADKMSLRIGLERDEFAWSDDSTGEHSFAGGFLSKAKGARAIAWGCESEANSVGATAFGFSVVSGAYGVGLGQTEVTANYGIAIGKEAKAKNTAAIAIGRSISSDGQRSVGLGNYLNPDTTDAIIIGKGVNAFNLLVNNIPNSIMLGVNSTTPTMTIVKDTTKIDTVLVCNNIIGTLTGNATTASTCTTWTGSGTVDDSLAAHKTDIAALQATKVDTNKAYVHRDSRDYEVDYISNSKQWGNNTHPLWSPQDTIVVTRIYACYYPAGAGAWEFIMKNTAGDTIAWTDTISTAGQTSYENESPTNATITPADGWVLYWTEISGTMAINRLSWAIEYYYPNP